MSSDSQEIADCLRGTCDGDLFALIQERGLEFEEDRICNEVDQLVFQCTACGWWCGIEEEASADHDLNEWTCLECCEEQSE